MSETWLRQEGRVRRLTAADHLQWRAGFSHIRRAKSLKAIRSKKEKLREGDERNATR